MTDSTSTAPARVIPPAIVVTHQAGVRFAAKVGAHTLILDQPVSGGGEDAGPSPLELLGVGLGACIALYVHRFLVTRNIADDGLRVEVSAQTARTPYRIARYEVQILLSTDVPSVYKPMIETAARVCPAYNTLARSADIVITISAPLAVA